MFNKLKAFYYYNKAIKHASELNFLDALNYLYKTPVNVRTLYFYMLQGYLLEHLGKFEESLTSYDNANNKIVSDKKTNEDEKEYLRKYIDYGYANIYKMTGDINDSKKFLSKANSRTFNRDNIKKYILEDFPIVENSGTV